MSQLRPNHKDQTFDYMMLDRLKSDCEYFLNWGNGCLKHLWAGNISAQIAEMKKIYERLAIKPEWISLNDILEYEKKMKVFVNYIG